MYIGIPLQAYLKILLNSTEVLSQFLQY